MIDDPHLVVVAHGDIALGPVVAQITAEVEIGSDAPERALAVARDYGFTAERDTDADAVVVRLAAGDVPQVAAAALNHALCAAGVRVHALAPRRRSLETLYRQAAQPAAAA